MTDIGKTAAKSSVKTTAKGSVETAAKSSAETSSRSAILRAATEEFALKGYAGARTDGIAHAAGVKHTLLFYHFKRKEQLYGAVLETVFSDWAERVSRALDERATPKQRLLVFINAYFDFVAEFPFAPRLVQQEQLRQRTVGSEHLHRLAERYIRPVHRKLLELLREGISSGEFRDLDIEHCVHSLSALIIFYFTSDLTAQLLGVVDPCSPPHIAARREAVLDFVSAALFAPGYVRK
jgi:TetR/AcrR family transcriptional regulator